MSVEDQTVATTDHGGRTTRSDGVPEVRRGQSVGRYLILDRIGAGAMGVVYRAYDPELDRRVAVKLIGRQTDPAAVARLLREAQALAKLSHPHVVTVHDVGAGDDAVFVAMEMVEGDSLADRLTRGRPAWDDAVRIFVDAGRGLAAAHRAGLCHRDFKPSNVLLTEDGVAKVADFGLARPTDVALEDSASQRDRLRVAVVDERLTGSGAAAGTPAYMAPEAHAGEPADARSDEFSFFVALHESLTGARPYRGDGPEALEAAKREGPPDLPRALPLWLRRMVARGLSPDPARRFGDMDRVVAELERGLARRRRTVVLGGAIAITATVAVVALRSSADTTCTQGTDRIATVWSSSRAEQVSGAIAATGVSYAEQTVERVVAQLDAYALAWAEASDDACRATRVDRTQSQDLLDLKMLCLDNAREELRALVDLLVEADPALAECAVTAVSGLSPVQRCSTAAVLGTSIEPPPEAVATDVRAVRQILAEVRALELAGKYELGVQRAAVAIEDAEAIGYPPLIARARLRHGRHLERLGDIDEAIAELREAHWLAEAHRDDLVAAQAATLVVFSLGHHERDVQAALEWGRHARVAVQHVGLGGPEEAELLNAMGATRSIEGKHERARELFAEALALKRDLFPHEHHQISLQLGNLGIALEDLGRFDEARAHYEEALEILSRTLGPRHPQTAAMLFNLAGAAEQQGEFDEALDFQERALAIKRETLQPGHRSLGISLNGLGTALRNVGRFEDARQAHREAIEVLTGAVGEQHPVVANAYNNLGIVLRVLGELEESQRAHEHAVQIWRDKLGERHPHLAVGLTNLGAVAFAREDAEEALTQFLAAKAIADEVLGPEHPRMASLEANVGSALLALERPDEARPHFDASAAVLAKRFPADHPQVADVEEHLGRLELAVGDEEAAKGHFERALKIRSARPDALVERAKVSLALAQVIHGLGERDRAVALAQQADEWFRTTQLPEDEREQARRWLDSVR